MEPSMMARVRWIESVAGLADCEETLSLPALLDSLRSTDQGSKSLIVKHVIHL
jgi:hypothetical protein